MDRSAPLLTFAKAQEEIRRFVRRRGPGALSFPRHARERASERNFDARDVEYVLMNGSIDEVDWDERFGSWRCRVRGTDVDGEDLTVIVALDPAWERITIITGF
ncbi:MAG: DUF4258 domain-containing protein [Acidobacteria bacterium]|nr:DUF4258 domain-containing protein [Acidobacteriota bacterium]